MKILCDTSSVLMVIRIAPDMFREEKFGCVTIADVRKELFQTQRFKSKYPWRVAFKEKVKILGTSKTETGGFELYYEAIKKLVYEGTVNKKTKKLFGLSPVDQRIVACALDHGFGITSGDVDLIHFFEQEFSSSSKNVISPLGLVNRWLKKGLIQWGKNQQSILKDWKKCKEPFQPKKQINSFERLTKYKYPRY